MEDVLEEIVGEIWDEDDKVKEDIVQLSKDVFVVDGDLNIDEFRELLGFDEDEFDFESETAGGWVIEYLEKFPEKCESFEYEGMEFTVLGAGERRVEKIQVRR